jgi:hypothetical protein
MTRPGPFDFSQYRPDLKSNGAATAPVGDSLGESPLYSRPDVSETLAGTGGDVAQGPFGTDEWAGTDDLVTSGAPSRPVTWLCLASVAALAGLVVAAPRFTSTWLYAMSWLLAGPVAVGLLAVYSRRDTQQQAKVFYTISAWSPWAYRAVLVVSALGVLLSAWRIADWVGRL